MLLPGLLVAALYMSGIDNFRTVISSEFSTEMLSLDNSFFEVAMALLSCS